MGYLFEHTRLGFCWWDLLAVAIMAALFFVFRDRIKELKEKKKNLEDEIVSSATNEALNIIDEESK